VLEGRPFHDVWICPARGLRAERMEPPGEWGTVSRFYAPHIKAWRSAWVGSATEAMHCYIAQRECDEIVLRGGDNEAI
jgi:hypothetical protein